MVLDDKGDVYSGSHAVEGRRSSQASYFDAGSKAAGTAPNEAVAEPEGQENKDVTDTRDLNLVWV